MSVMFFPVPISSRLGSLVKEQGIRAFVDGDQTAQGDATTL